MLKSRPIISSQQYRAGQAIRAALSARVEIPAEDLFTLYSVRLSQTGVVDHAERINVKADLAFYVRASDGRVLPKPLLIVFLDQAETAFFETRHLLEERKVPFAFSTSAQALVEPESIIAQRSGLDLVTKDDKPFNHGETKYLIGILRAIHAKGMSDSVLLTGQVALSSFTQFDGYSHDSSKSDTDADFLICTPPPVCFPIMAIEVDGPHHYSLSLLKEKHGDTKKAQAELAQEKRKSVEKDSAYEKAGIAVIHVRVNSRYPSVRDQNMVFFCNAVISCVDHIIKTEDVLEKKAAWISSITDDLKGKILSQESGKRFFSKSPELEDAFLTLSELCEAYQREIEGHRAGLLERVYASIDAEAKKSTQEGSALVGLYKDWELLNSIQADGWDGATRVLSPFRGDAYEGDDGATMQQEIVFGTLPGSGSPINLYSSTERLPFIICSGYFPGDFQEQFIGFMISEMKENILRRIPKIQRDKILSHISEMLEIDEYMLQQRLATKKISAMIDTDGPRAIILDLERRAAGAIRGLLQMSGVISPLEDRVDPKASSPAWEWTDKTSRRPNWWDEETQTLNSLDDVIAAVREAPTAVRKRARSDIEAWGNRRLEFLEAAGTQIDIVGECAAVLEAIQRRIL